MMLSLFYIGYVLGVMYGLLLLFVLMVSENYYLDVSMISIIVLGVIIFEMGLFMSFFWGVYIMSWIIGLDFEGFCLLDLSFIVLVWFWEYLVYLWVYFGYILFFIGVF